jgi:hypothetical protein
MGYSSDVQVDEGIMLRFCDRIILSFRNIRIINHLSYAKSIPEILHLNAAINRYLPRISANTAYADFQIVSFRHPIKPTADVRLSTVVQQAMIPPVRMIPV